MLHFGDSKVNKRGKTRRRTEFSSFTFEKLIGTGRLELWMELGKKK